jgi:hypothetical protein
MSIAICKKCGAILESNKRLFIINLWPYSLNIITCWFCRYAHKTEKEIQYKSNRSIVDA